jgi:hypothetical protein
MTGHAGVILFLVNDRFISAKFDTAIEEMHIPAESCDVFFVHLIDDDPIGVLKPVRNEVPGLSQREDGQKDK